jgi:hypothetical protein
MTGTRSVSVPVFLLQMAFCSARGRHRTSIFPDLQSRYGRVQQREIPLLALALALAVAVIVAIARPLL